MVLDRFRGKKKQEELRSKAENMSEEEIQEHGKHYSDSGFWNKIGNVAKKAGSKVVYVALLLYYTLKSPEVPKRLKLTVVGGLGYFILPLDFIPDFLIGFGFVDDLGVLMASLYKISKYIDDDIKARAKAKLVSFFGDDVKTNVIDKIV